MLLRCCAACPPPGSRRATAHRSARFVSILASAFCPPYDSARAEHAPAHDPEKWAAVLGRDHAQAKGIRAPRRLEWITLAMSDTARIAIGTSVAGVPEAAPRGPRAAPTGLLGWLRANLFS